MSFFRNINVADFAWVGVAPITSRYFADYGATTVRVESNLRPETLRFGAPFRDGKPTVNGSPFFANFNAGKYGMSLNLKHPRAKEVAARLLRWADIMTDSFTAGSMKRLGLDYEWARSVNPSIIYISSTNQGQTGTYRSHPGFGTQLASLSGFISLSGWPDRTPAATWGAYTDWINPKFGVAFLTAALERRRLTGQGMYIDQSQMEGALQFLAPWLLDYTVNGRVANRQGNRTSRGAPHNAYPCAGEDRWCVITVFNDAHWTALKKAMGDPAWASEPRFGTVLGRKRNEEELDVLIGGWTQALDAHEVMRALQAEGVPAGVVQSGKDLFEDPQLKHRGHYVEHDHCAIGRHHYDSFAFRLSELDGGPQGPGPCLGEHNDILYRDILGYSEEELAELIIDGVLD